MFINMAFHKIRACRKIIKQHCVCALKKAMYSEVKLVKNSDTIKLANFNTAESTILTDKYVTQIVKRRKCTRILTLTRLVQILAGNKVFISINKKFI